MTIYIHANLPLLILCIRSPYIFNENYVLFEAACYILPFHLHNSHVPKLSTRH